MEQLIKENPAAAEWLPENKPDGSGIGANYVDAFLKPLNCELEDELRLACKRRGLRITVSVGDRKGEPSCAGSITARTSRPSSTPR